MVAHKIKTNEYHTPISGPVKIVNGGIEFSELFNGKMF